LNSGRVKSCGCLVHKRTGVPRKNLTGMIFGRLTVIGLSRFIGNKSIWKCLCSCGTELDVIGNSLSTGNTRSCGCLLSESASRMNIARNTTHGLSKTKEYHRMISSKRKEAQKMLDFRWTIEMESALWRFFGNTGCVVCGSKNDLTVDHVVPLSAGRGLYPDNAVVLCRSCNSRKRKSPVEKLSPEIRDAILFASDAFYEYCSGIGIL
jgi:5-methylcytosine-specific restriction endonuclease McrA